MRMKQLEYLVDIMQTGSITNTAQRLFLSQQAVSKSIRQLEQELGCDLFIRTKAGVKFTEKGQEVVAFALKVLEEEKSLNERLQAIDERPKNSDAVYYIDLCSASSVTNIALPSIIAELNAKQKSVFFRLAVANHFDSVIEHVKNESCDIGLMTINEAELNRKLPEIQENLQVDYLVRDEMMVVMDKRFYTGSVDSTKQMSCYRSSIRTLYNILTIDSFREQTYNASILYSNDAQFHRNMMRNVGSMTMMSGLDYQYYFNDKKYVALPFKNGEVSVIHAALYRKNPEAKVRNFITMLRRIMYEISP